MLYEVITITVDAILIKFSKFIQSIIYGITIILCTFVSAPIAVRMLGKGIANLSKRNVATGTLGIPLAPFYIVAALGCFSYNFV